MNCKYGFRSTSFQKRPGWFWCYCVRVNSSVQLLFIEGMLRATLQTVAICLASEKSPSEICPAQNFLAQQGEIHSKHITLAMISLGRNRTYLFCSSRFLLHPANDTCYQFSVDELQHLQSLWFSVFLVGLPLQLRW